MNEVKKEKKDSWSGGVKGFADWLGTYGWIFLLITGIIYIVVGLIYLTGAAIFGGFLLASDLATLVIYGVLYFIGGILAIIFTVVVVKPR